MIAIVLLLCGPAAAVQAMSRSHLHPSTVPSSASVTGAYVALGDSVAAGEGDGGYVTPTACHRSVKSYPYLLASVSSDTFPWPVISTACTGATIPDIVDDDQHVNGKIIPSQLSQVPTGTPISTVTVTAGIDDPVLVSGTTSTGWVQILQNCVLNGYSVCAGYQNAITDWISNIQGEYGSSLLPALHALPGSPTIYVTGYYDPLPTADLPLSDAVQCPEARATINSDVNDGTVGLIRGWETQLNRAIETATIAGGAQFISLTKAIPPAHGVCTPHAWVFNPTLQTVLTQQEVAAMIHPTPTGQKAIAATIRAAIPPAPGVWTAPQALGQGMVAQAPGIVGTDAGGNLTAVWEDYDPTTGQQPAVADQLPAGANDWLPTTTISPSSGGGPEVVVAPSGEAIVGFNDSTPDIQSNPGVGWAPTGNVPVEPGTTPQGFQYFIDNPGSATAIWSAYDASKSEWLVQSSYLKAGGSWGAPTTIARSTTGVGGLCGSANGSGALSVEWFEGYSLNSGASSLYTATQFAGGAWSSPTRVSARSSTIGITSNAIATDQKGDTMAAWIQSSTQVGQPSILETRFWPANGSWGPIRTVSDASASGYSNVLSVALSATGVAMMAWYTEPTPTDDLTLNLDVATSSAGGGWSSPQVLVGDQEVGTETPEVAMDGTGDAVVAWANANSANNSEQILAATRQAGGAWSTPATVSAALDQNGDTYYIDGIQPIITPGGVASIVWSDDETGLGWAGTWVYAASTVQGFPPG